MGTCSQNKTAYCVLQAGVVPKPQAPKGTGQAKKAAKEEAHITQKKKQMEALTQLAHIKHEGTKNYAMNDTPRPVHPAHSACSACPDSQEKVVSSNSESELSYVPDSESTTESKTENELTDDLTDIQVTVKKKRVPQKSLKVRDAVNHINQNLMDVNLVTPNVQVPKRNKNPIESSVSTIFY